MQWCLALLVECTDTKLSTELLDASMQYDYNDSCKIFWCVCVGD